MWLVDKEQACGTEFNCYCGKAEFEVLVGHPTGGL